MKVSQIGCDCVFLKAHSLFKTYFLNCPSEELLCGDMPHNNCVLQSNYYGGPSHLNGNFADLSMGNGVLCRQ